MKLNTKKIILAFLSGLLLTTQTLADLTGEINRIISQPLQQKVVFSINIIKAETGQQVYSHNANTALIPASNMKIITSSAALKYLGTDYEFKTTIYLDGDTLVVIGGGDPLLGDRKINAKHNREPDWIFKDIAQKLKDKGITSIKDIIVDSSIFDDQRVHENWPKEQLNKWYACEISGLNYNDNCIDITVRNTASGISVSLDPPTNYVTIVNQVTSTKAGASVIGAYRNQQPNKIILKGRCRIMQGPFSVAIERPAAFFGYLLAENLSKEGIKATGELIGMSVDSNLKLLEVASYVTPMVDCLERCNKNSLNIAAECLMKSISAKFSQTGKNGSWDDSKGLISNYLVNLGLSNSEFNIDDGCGLSRENKVSSNVLTKVLYYNYKSSYWDMYRDSLAAGGVDGTINKYFEEPKYKGKIFGKTGYIAGVKSFSGICTTNNADYIFSILANDTQKSTKINVRTVLNNIAKAIIDNN